MEFIRTFIAIELPEEIKRELDALQEKLNLKGEAGLRCVKPATTHLTLKFLGSTPVEQLEEIKVAMLQAAQGTRTFQLELKDVGCFPNTRQPRVIWVGLSGGEELQFLQMQLEESLEKLGFPRENRAFTAHLTLARLRDDCGPSVRRRLGEVVQNTGYQPGVKFTAGYISLIKSVLKPTGPEYTVLYQANLS